MPRTQDPGVVLSGTEVNAALEGRLTSLLFAVDPQPSKVWEGLPYIYNPYATTNYIQGGELGGRHTPVRSPLRPENGPVWVRESWCFADGLSASGKRGAESSVVAYKSDLSAVRIVRINGQDQRVPLVTNGWQWNKARWRNPGSTMPWFSRLSLVNVKRRVVRLHDLTVDDIKALGVRLPPFTTTHSLPVYQLAMKAEWDGANYERRRVAAMKRGGGREELMWDSNPWVWRFTFDVVKR